MKKKNYSNVVYENLSKNKKISLSMLFEEDESENDSGDVDSDSADSGSDPFSVLDKKDEELPSGEEAGEEKSSEDTDDGETSVEDSSEDSANAQLIQLKQTLKDIVNTSRKRYDISHMTPTIFDITGESVKKNVSIKKFLNEETEDAEQIVNDIQTILDKNDDLIKKVDKVKNKQLSGEHIDIDLEVSKAIHKLIHFNEQYDIVDLVKDLYLMKIKMLAPGKEISEKVKEFKEKYQRAVHKNKSKIKYMHGSDYYNDDSVYLEKPVKYNGAVGARSQG